MTQNDHEQAVGTDMEIEQDVEAEDSAEDQELTVDAADTPQDEGEENDPDVLRAQVQEVQDQAAEYLDGWQRARAEFVNYRRREDQRRKQTNQQIRCEVFKRLLPVLDDMERAFQTVPDDVKDDPWVEGLAMVGQKLLTALEKDGLSVMSTQAGDPFNPNVHEAVLCEPSVGYDDGQIIQVLQQGYRIDETVLRPALVRVSSGRIDPQSQDD